MTGHVMPPDDEANTLEKYQANIASRFGKPPEGMSLAEWLARRESRAAKQKWERPASGHAYSAKEETMARRLGWAEAIMPISPCGRAEASKAWGIPENATDGRMQILESVGLARRVPGTRPIHWEITLDAGTLPKAARVLTATPQGGAA
jgi:hypothetical protein